MKTIWITCLCLPVLATLSCTPLDTTPNYSYYQQPYRADYSAYHRHGDHHHHHDDEKRNHYHPKNQWDNIAYHTANQSLSSQDIGNINAMTSQKKGKKKH